jgi:twinkle protein
MDIVELKSVAAQHVNQICLELLPEGIREGDCWKVGSIKGEKGRSLSCYLSGADAGKWTDFATGDHGDVIDLVRTIHGSTLLDSIDWIKKRFGIRDVDQAKK